MLFSHIPALRCGDEMNPTPRCTLTRGICNTVPSIIAAATTSASFSSLHPLLLFFSFTLTLFSIEKREWPYRRVFFALWPHWLRVFLYDLKKLCSVDTLKPCQMLWCIMLWYYSCLEVPNATCVPFYFRIIIQSSIFFFFMVSFSSPYLEFFLEAPTATYFALLFLYFSLQISFNLIRFFLL